MGRKGEMCVHIEQLEFIVSVATTLSFSKTAEKLFVSQSAISQSIKKLEEELGFEIFHRTRYGVILTEKGKEMIDHAEEVLKQWEQLKKKVIELSETDQDDINIGVISGLHLPFLPSIISQLKKEYPHQTINIIEKSSVDITEAVINKELHIGVIAVYENTLKKKDKIQLEYLTDIDMFVFTHKDSTLTAYDFVSYDQLLSQTFIMFNGEFLTWYFNKFVKENGAVDLLFSSNNTETIREAIRKGIAITIDTQVDLINNPYIDKGEIVPIPLADTIACESYLGFVGIKRANNPPVVKEFMKLFKHHFQNTLNQGLAKAKEHNKSRLS